MSTENLWNLLRNFRAGTAFTKAVGARIRSERRAAGLTLKEACAQAECSEPFFSTCERGKTTPTPAILEVACSWRPCSVAYVLFGEDEEEKVVIEAAEYVMSVCDGVTPISDPDKFQRCVGEVMVTYGTAKARRIVFPIRHRVSATPNANIVWEPLEAMGEVELPSDLHAELVVGNSMNPVARDGQIVLMREKGPADGDLGMIELKTGERYFKKVWQEGKAKAFNLTSINEVDDHRPMLVPFSKVRRARRWFGTLAPD